MATALYVTSTETYSGKTALCIGLARRMQRDGLRVGYFKPLSFSAMRDDRGPVDEDTRIFKRTLGLKESLDVLCPVLITPALLESIVKGESLEMADKITSAYNTIAADKDVVIIEGANNIASGSLINMSGIEIVELFKAKSIVVVRYRADLILDHLLIAKRVVGDAEVGAVINTIPQGRLSFVENEVKAFCARRGIQVFAALPQDRLLMAVAAKEIADALDAQVLAAKDNLGNLVESIMVGGMAADSALAHFRRKANKAVIAGGDRTDLISAALETSTACLVLTGNIHPGAQILARAEEQAVPVILSSLDTMTTIEVVESVFGKVRFHDQKKMLRFESLLDERFDYVALYKALGVTVA